MLVVGAFGLAPWVGLVVGPVLAVRGRGPA